MKYKTNLAIALLFSVPAVAVADRVSINDLATKLDDKPELRFVSSENEVLDGSNAQFQIRVICQESFNVKSIYATVRDQNATVDINFFSANLLASPFGGQVSPPTDWLVAHQDFMVSVSANSVGYELLSNMNIPSLGVGTGGTFDILGTRSPNTQATTMTIGAVVETTNKSSNECSIVIVDF